MVSDLFTSQTTFVVVVFAVVYVGMFLGGLPRLHLDRTGVALSTLTLSNLVSNVPAVMLLLPVAGGAHAGPTLALVSTLAGNPLIVGSIANIIVVDAARRQGIEIHWRMHARVGTR